MQPAPKSGSLRSAVPGGRGSFVAAPEFRLGRPGFPGSVSWRAVLEKVGARLYFEAGLDDPFYAEPIFSRQTPGRRQVQGAGHNKIAISIPPRTDGSPMNARAEFARAVCPH